MKKCVFCAAFIMSSAAFILGSTSVASANKMNGKGMGSNSDHGIRAKYFAALKQQKIAAKSRSPQVRSYRNW